ncbi:hypothetical protein L6164_021017 [Bauhinia variegata]|uniref:Uncharacterized protein n=1 Tax=Bauhinia variegata TaxID=167791 RepID=A0ACB9MYI7_BAUVA|nr:hypothetical protein L6164_021017 [Bauhinia variegata]
MGSGMEFFRRTLFLVVICALAAASNAQYEVSTDRKFKCSTEGATCLALVDYRPASGTYGGIQTLFNIRELRDIQGVNLQLKDTISPNDQVIPLGVIRIPFTRKCQDALGTSINGPFYKIQSDETLEHIGKVVFSNIVKWPQIQKANNISDPFNISMGQELRIPLPCSCDQVEGTMLVHYGRVFQNISTSYLEEMAQTAGIAVETMKDLNGILDESQIQAGEIYDVPLKGLFCSSS